MVLALVRNKLEGGAVALEAAVKALYLLYQVPLSGLTQKEENRLLTLEDSWSLARDGIYGDQKSVGNEVMEFLQHYFEYEKELPL